MKQNLKTFLIILLGLASLVGCSEKKAPSTTTTISLGAAYGDAAFQNAISGGLIIAAQNRTGPGGFFVNVESEADLIKELPNGTWDFMGVAWDGDRFSGNVYCEVFTKVLNGEDPNVTLMFDKGKCENNPFNAFGQTGDPFFETDGMFKRLKFLTCANFQPDAAEAFATGGGLPPGMDCAEEAGRAKSFRLSIAGSAFHDITVDEAGNPISIGGQAEMVSECIGVDTNGDSLVSAGEFASELRMPYFFNHKPLPIIISSFDGDDCLGAEDKANFPNALGHHDPTYKGATQSVGSYTNVYLDSILCQGSGLDNNTFAGQPFNASSTNYICTPNQLAFVESNISHMTGKFQVIGELDLTGETITIGVGSTFYGEFRDSHFINGTEPLFNTVGANARLSRITLDNFNITKAGGSNYGILINNIEAMVGSSSEFQEIEIKNSSFTHTGSGDSLGGIIGHATNAHFRLERLKMSDVTLDITSAHSGKVGMIIGRISSSGTTGNVDITANDADIVNATIVAGGSDNIGGAFGHINFAITGTSSSQRVNLRDSYFEELDIQEGGVGVGGVLGNADGSTNSHAEVEIYKVNMKQNVTTNQIRGNNYVGGIVGNNVFHSRIMKTDVDVTLAYHSAGATYDEKFGGLAGETRETYINDNLVKVKFHTVDNNHYNYVGGIAGNAYDSNIKNNDVNVDFDLNGEYVGGIAGNIDGSISHFNIEDCRIQGTINKKSVATNSKRGGIIGSSYDKASIKNCYVGLSLYGKNLLGGVNGHMEPAGTGLVVESIYLDGYIEGRMNDSIGGVSGYAGSDSIFHNIIMNNSVRSLTASNTSIGRFGRVVNSCGGRFANIALLGDLNIGVTPGSPVSDPALFGGIDCSSTATGDMGSGIFFNTTYPQDLTSVDFSSNASDSGHWFNNGGTAELKFMKSWALMDNASLASRSFGTFHDPFYINNVADWNKISDNSKLMGKSFALGNDIDFGNVFTSPIGSFTTPFVGNFSPNYKKITRAHFDVTGHDQTGLFGQLGRGSSHALGEAFGQIGDYDDPVVIDDLRIFGSSASGASYGGVVGILADGNLIARVGNGVIDLPLSTGRVGGLVGTAFRGSIAMGGYEGSISVGGSHVGGIIGKVNHNVSGEKMELRLEGLAAKISSLTANSNVGGIVGLYQVGASQTESRITLEESYVEVTGKIEITSAGNRLAGLIGNYQDDSAGTGAVDVRVAYVNMEGSQGFDGTTPISDAFFNISGAQGNNYNFDNTHIVRSAENESSGLSGGMQFHSTMDGFISTIINDYNWDLGYDWQVEIDGSNKKSVVQWWQGTDVRCFDQSFADANGAICNML